MNKAKSNTNCKASPENSGSWLQPVGTIEQQFKGLANQPEGKTQEKIGGLKEAVNKATN
ncbi:hypothetical protein [Massilia violaceinigra]|uniref:hypothetical protein n=1 Tax=Massilia violaceinigra TaxID=2045208 RepID=UPI001E3EF104|nr:hypothetical protein [Massilia violaceinigra]